MSGSVKNNFFKLKKISWKLTIVYAAMFSFVLVVLSAGVLYSLRSYLVQQSFDQVQESTSITISNIMDSLNENHKLDNNELLSEAAAKSKMTVRIADENGNIVISSDDEGKGLSITSDLGITKRIDINDTRFVVRNTEIKINGKTTAYLQMIKDMATEYSLLKIVTISIGISDIIGVLISIFVGYLVSQRMLKPLDKITKTAKEISISDLNKKIEVKDNDDELTRLAKTFNEMIERLRLSFEKQNRFVSDASHELRTPISVIQGHIQLIDRWGKNDKIVLDESIEAIKNETKDMGALVEKLLFLARSDTGKLSVNKEKFDLYDLAEEIVMENGMIFSEQPIKSEVSKNTVLYADRKLLKQALRAIIDNSIKYSPNHDEIRIFSMSSHNELVISIQDKGIGIPKEMIKEIFERFYRVDSARTRKTGGTGLGLAIVEMIINVHGGKIIVESDLGKGTLVSIILPID
jgi:two-component system sensor histidine kinase ArlS